MPDYTDDWMNPKTSHSWTAAAPKNETEYRILRKKATIVTGNVSSIYSWEVWSTHPTSEARDAELARLREEHPVWQLRAAEGNPYLESLGLGRGGT